MHLVPLDDRPALAGGGLFALLAFAILLGLVVCDLRISTVAEASALRKLRAADACHKQTLMPDHDSQAIIMHRRGSAVQSIIDHTIGSREQHTHSSSWAPRTSLPENCAWCSSSQALTPYGPSGSGTS